MALLMTGDVAGADAMQKQYDDAHAAAHDPALPYHQAEWLWISGRRKEAYQRLSAFAQQIENGPLKEVASGAYSELALWSLMVGDRNGANEMVRKAVQFAGPKSAANVVVARFLAQPPASAEEWNARADQLFHNGPAGPVKQLWLAYALLLNKDFANAGVALQRFVEAGGSGDESIPVLQAWTLVETGKESEAAALLRFLPAPPMAGPGLFTSFYFPRFYYLRGAVAEKQGMGKDARAAYQLFLKLSGPTPLEWGEELKALQAVQ